MESISSLTKEKDKIEEKIRMNLQENQGYEERIEQLNNEIKEASNNINYKIREIDILNEQISVKEAEIETKNNEISRLDLQIRDIDIEISNIINIIVEKNVEKNTLSSKLHEVNAKIQENAQNPEVQRLNNEIEEINTQITNITDEISRLSTEIQEKESKVNEFNTNINTSTTQKNDEVAKLSNINSSLQDIRNSINALNQSIDEISREIESVDEEIRNNEETIRTLEAGNSGNDGNQTLEQKRNRLEEVKGLINAVTTRLEENKTAVETQKKKGSKGFFETVGSTSAAKMFENKTYYSYEETQNGILEQDTHLGETNDSTSLENMLSALDFIEEANKVRKQLNKSEFRVNDILMAESQIRANWNKHRIKHFGFGFDTRTEYADGYNKDSIRTYFVGENLAWGYSTKNTGDPIANEARYRNSPFFGWVYAERFNLWDQEVAENVDKDGDGVIGKISGYTDEIIRVNRTPDYTGGQTGHYTNFIGNYQLTGYGYSPESKYGTGTNAQRFGNLRGESSNPSDTPYTVAEYRKRLQDYIAGIETNINEENERLNSQLQNLNTEKTDLEEEIRRLSENNNEEQLNQARAKREELNSRKSNLQSQLQSKNDEKATLNEQVNGKEQEKRTTEEKIEELNSLIESENQKKTAIQDQVAQLMNQKTEKEAEIQNKKSMKLEKLNELERIDSEYTRNLSLKEKIERDIAEKESEISTLEAQKMEKDRPRQEKIATKVSENEKLLDLQNQLQEYRNNLNNLNNEKTQFENILTNKRQELEDHLNSNMEYSRLLEKLEAVKKELETKGNEKENIEAELTTMLKRKEVLTRPKSSSYFRSLNDVDGFTDLDRELSYKKKELEYLKRDLNVNKEKISELENEIQEIEKRLAEKKKDLDLAVDYYNELQPENNNMLTENKDSVLPNTGIDPSIYLASLLAGTSVAGLFALGKKKD